MGRRKFTVLSLASISILIIICMTIILKYPLNLIIDGIFLSMVGFFCLLYFTIWSFLKDNVEIYKRHILITTHKFPFMNIERRRVNFIDVKFFTINDFDVILILKKGEIIHIEFSRKRARDNMKNLLNSLNEKRIKKIDYNRYIKETLKERKSYWDKI